MDFVRKIKETLHSGQMKCCKIFDFVVFFSCKSKSSYLQIKVHRITTFLCNYLNLVGIRCEDAKKVFP